MSFWRRSVLFKDPEIELGRSSQIQSPLQSYEVVIAPSPSYSCQKVATAAEVVPISNHSQNEDYCDDCV